MSTVFSGGTYVNTTFTGDTKANIISNIQTQLTNAGWTVVSGGGTTNLLMQTALGADGHNQGRVRFKDNAGSCVQITIENVSGSRAQISGTGAGGNLLPATGKTYRILASKYRFEVFTPTSSGAREFVCAGILAIPTPYVGTITEAIYLQGNARSDTDTSVEASFRSNLHGTGNCAGIYNGSIYERSSNNDGWLLEGDVSLRVCAQSAVSGFNSAPTLGGWANLYRWAPDNAIDMFDALMGWATSNQDQEAFLRGQVYDWTIIADSFAADTVDSWADGGSTHNFFALTVNWAGSSGYPKGTIWVAYS